MAADRGAYIDQSQSFNAHMGDINYGKLTSMHFYGWKKVSTICYFNAVDSENKLNLVNVWRLPIVFLIVRLLFPRV